MVPTDNSQVLTNNLDVLFVIDNTLSMGAEDYNGKNTRISGVKEDCKYIIEELSGARFSIIAFNNTAKILIPYTNDTNITLEAINILSPIGEATAKGSSLNTPLDTIITSLKSSQSKSDRIRILFFISDGEITDDSSLKSFKEISKYVSDGAILGYGTPTGGYMKSNDPYLEDDYYITDFTSDDLNKAVSKIDEDNLKKIANDINIDYIHMEAQSKIHSKINNIKKLISSNIESSDKSSYEDTYYILVIPLLILLILEFNQYRRKA